jgi:hypothetical protein
MICAFASWYIVKTVVRSLNARIPNSPICNSSDAGSPFRSNPERSVCGVRLESLQTFRALEIARMISVLPEPDGPTSSGHTTSPSA